MSTGGQDTTGETPSLCIEFGYGCPNWRQLHKNVAPMSQHPCNRISTSSSISKLQPTHDPEVTHELYRNSWNLRMGHFSCHKHRSALALVCRSFFENISEKEKQNHTQHLSEVSGSWCDAVAGNFAGFALMRHGECLEHHCLASLPGLIAM